MSGLRWPTTTDKPLLRSILTDHVLVHAKGSSPHQVRAVLNKRQRHRSHTSDTFFQDCLWANLTRGFSIIPTRAPCSSSKSGPIGKHDCLHFFRASSRVQPKKAFRHPSPPIGLEENRLHLAIHTPAFGNYCSSSRDLLLSCLPVRRAPLCYPPIS